MDSSEDINQQYTKLTFTPTQADRIVLEFRKWLRRHGNSQPKWLNTTIQPLPSTVLSKRQMLDRFQQHTLECSSCKQAYTSFQTWKNILVSATVAFSASTGIPSDFWLSSACSGFYWLSLRITSTRKELRFYGLRTCRNRLKQM